jgi:hypothetical protein
MANVPRPATCQACGKPLPEQKGRGRQRQYCNASCRSAARRSRAEPAVDRAHVNTDLTESARKANLDVVAGDRATDRAPLAERVLAHAGHLAGRLASGGDGSLTAVTAARDLARVVEEAMRAAVEEARAAGRTWQEIGEVLGTSRQAAFQRFGRPIDPRTGVVMAERTLPGAAEHAVALVAEVAEGRWEQARRDFDEAMVAGVSADRLAAVWAQVVGTVGAYQGIGEPVAHQAGDLTVVDVPLLFEAGEMTARVSYRQAGLVAGLYVRPPDGPGH